MLMLNVPLGDDTLLQPECIPLYPPEMGSSPGFCFSLWNSDPEAIQVLVVS